jgi:hypothetical protein
VRLDPPLFVRVSVTLPVLPICTFPKLTLLGLADSVPGTTPVADNPTFSVELDALLVIVTLPVAVPAVLGENFTLKLVLCPPASVKGTLMPLTLKPAPLALTWEIVTLAPPEFVSVSDRVLLLLVCTLPKLKLAGLGVSWPGVTPVPDSGTLALDTLLTMATLPVTPPAAAGLNFTENVVLCDGPRVVGKVSPLALNPVPVTVACVIVRLDPPVLLMVSDRP